MSSKARKPAMTMPISAELAAPSSPDEKKRQGYAKSKQRNFVILFLLLVGTAAWAVSVTAVKNNGSLLLFPSLSSSSHNNVQVPECPTTPWKPKEDLVGTCPGDLKPVPGATSVAACAMSCCTSEECITWQYRADVGCKHGPDVRVGMEKDGPAAYCSAHPPYKWQGQYLLKRGEDNPAKRALACHTDTWKPNSEPGQCFGLGDQRTQGQASKSAEKCMQACCADASCRAWQFQKELGCFYGKGMFSCQPSDNPMVFEAFVGRRKQRDSRTYSA